MTRASLSLSEPRRQYGRFAREESPETATACVYTPLGTPFKKRGLHNCRHEQDS